MLAEPVVRTQSHGDALVPPRGRSSSLGEPERPILSLGRIENGHGPLESRRGCQGCLGYLVTRPMARDHGILSVTAIVRPLEYFDVENGGVVDEIAFFSSKRKC